MEIPNTALEDVLDALTAARDEIYRLLDRAADSHYDNIIFQPSRPGQTPFEKYCEGPGRDTWEIYDRLNSSINTIELGLSGFYEKD